MYHRQKRGRLGAAFPPTVQPQTIPASVGGVNALTSLVGMPPTDALYLWNAVPSEYGLRLRRGYREWANGAVGDVRTIVPYDAQSGSLASDRLFAVTENGIYDYTEFNTTAPVQEVVFSNQLDGAGYGNWVNFTTDADNILVMFADERNGLYYYSGADDQWGRPDGLGLFPEITFPDGTTINDIAFVTVHKQRVWLVKRGSPDGYYLPVDAIGGEAKKFNFGSQFNNGGTLRGLWSWTIDGGDGVDDFLVAISGGGNVLVYYGPDPSLPQWSLRGQWYIGQPPQSRRLTTEYGGDLYLLSSYGITSARDLLNGVDYSDVKVGPSGKITRFVRADVSQNPGSWDWAMHIYPNEGFLQLVTPYNPDYRKPRQYVQNLLTQSWGWWRDVPMICAANQEGEYYIGGPDGKVWIYDGTLDGTTLDDSQIGTPIEFGGLTSFQPYTVHAQYLRPGYIRAIGILDGAIALNIRAVFDYQFNTDILQPPPTTRNQGAIWDIDLWDDSFWDFETSASSKPIGASGLGRTMAIGWRGSSEGGLTITAWDVMYQTGGLL